MLIRWYFLIGEKWDRETKQVNFSPILLNLPKYTLMRFTHTAISYIKQTSSSSSSTQYTNTTLVNIDEYY